MLLNVLLEALASIPQIHQSIFKINRAEITIFSKTVYTRVLVEEKCPDATDVRIEVSRAV